VKLLRSVLLLFVCMATVSVFAQKQSGMAASSDYSEAVSRADRLLFQGNYLQAINEYEKAWDLYPRQTYPEKKISQIRKTLLNTPLSRMLFEEAVRTGDSCISVKDYKSANIAYYNAVRLNPDASYPRQQLSEIAEIYKDPQNDMRCRVLQIHAGKLAERGRYDKSIDNYRQVLLFKPSETWVLDKIREDSLLYLKKTASMDAYARCIDQADKLLEQKRWTEARTFYNQADEMRPGEKIAAQRINLLDHLLSFSSGSLPDCASLTATADRFYELGDLENARIHYEQALELNKNDSRLKNMTSKLTRVCSKEYIPKNYDAAVNNADMLCLSGDLAAGTIAYQHCLQVMPDDAYVLSRISELSQLSNSLKQSEKAYQAALGRADVSYSALNYSKALSEYRYAAMLRPTEAYPKTKIEELQALLAKKSGNEKNEKEVKPLAQNPMPESGTPVALKPVTSHMPDTGYIRERSDKTEPAEIAENTLIPAPSAPATGSEMAMIPASAPEPSVIPRNMPDPETEIREKYKLCIAAADAEFSIKNYDAAMTRYEEAQGLQPGETYPGLKIADIRQIRENQKILAAGSPPKTKSDGDKKTIPSTSEPGAKKESVIPAVIAPAAAPVRTAKQKSDQESYDKALAFADQSYAEKNYAHALNGYKAAQRIRPEETYPQDQIAVLNDLLSKQNNVEKDYQLRIAEADKFNANQDYEQALQAYEAALKLMPGQKYPQEKIAVIRTALGQQKALQANYDKFIAAADRSMNDKKYSEATLAYRNALKLKPGEPYPQQKLDEVSTLLGQSREQLEKYNQVLAEADQAFQKKEYTAAIAAYESASGIRPGESYPKQRIALANLILSQQKVKRDRYSSVLAEADEAYETKNYTAAMGGYKSALLLFPEETYPKERIETLGSLMQEQKAAKENYSRSVMAAEKAFAAKDYAASIEAFQKAQAFLPDETLPGERITVILGIIALEEEKLNRQYKEYITQADQSVVKDEYTTALQAYKLASLLKPAEEYPRQRYNEINTLLMAKAKAVKQAYDETLAAADLAYRSLTFDQAADLYTKALQIKPGEVYPGQMIARIRKYMTDNSVMQISAEQFVLRNDTERRFSFKPVDINLRKNNYLVVRARTSGKVPPKVYISYGEGNLKNGGVILKNNSTGLLSDFVINISEQDKWFREDNNWLSLYAENGDLEIASILISRKK
jgi:tetratricopeptide (TPR) repeat protein